VRGDGSTAHEGIFDLDTGEFLHQSTQQGWRQDSTWARGLAWALYGFTTVYRFTRDARFLNTAQLLANFYIERTPNHGVPPNDWDEPNPQYAYESSAAAIAASGMLDLASLVESPAASKMYQQYACAILSTLTSPEFLANETPGYEGILKHGIYHLQKDMGVDESVAWGEYYFLEALSKITHSEEENV
jgi:unsaturated chondroitin disaccharide hydrolase